MELSLFHDRELQDRAELRRVLDAAAVAIATASRLAGYSVTWAEVEYPYEAHEDAEERAEAELRILNKEEAELTTPRTAAFHAVFAEAQRLALRVGQEDELAGAALEVYKRLGAFSEALPDEPISGLDPDAKAQLAAELEPVFGAVTDAQFEFLELAQARIGTFV